MKYFFLIVCLFVTASCMKSKEEYRQAITEVQEREELIQREEALEVPPEPLAPVNKRSRNQRSRGSNDKEGMGMDE